MTARGAARTPDLLWALGLALAAGLVYGALALRLAGTVYSEVINLAFDLDPAFFVAYLAGPPAADGMGINYKHPLWMLFRPFAWPFAAAGLQAKAVAGAAMALTGAVSVALAYGVVRATGARRPETVLATLFFAAGATPLFTALVPESYGWALMTLLALWWVYRHTLSAGWAAERPAPLPLRTAVAVAVAGATVSNVVQALIAEGVDAWRGQRRLGDTLRGRWLPFALALALGVLAVLALNQPGDLWRVVTDPLKSARDVLWQTTRGPTTGPRAVLETYFVFSFFAPAFTEVPLSGVAPMLDFREWRYPAWMLAVVAAWLAFVVLNVAIAWRARQGRRWVAALAAALAFNLLFHLGYQYRGSLFIYAAHLHVPLFLLALSAAPWAGRRGGVLRAAYLAALAVFAAAALAGNLPRAEELVRRMQTLPDPAAVKADPAFRV